METTNKTAREMLAEAAQKEAVQKELNKVVWTEVAKVPIERGVNGYGLAPLMFSQQIGSGTLPNGRDFDILLNLSSGALAISIEAAKDAAGVETDKSRVYVVDPGKLLEAIVAAEFPE
jgi:hypothetical protein